MNKKAVNKEAIGQLTWRLFAICVLAAVLLGATYAITKDAIAEQTTLKIDTARKQVLPEADRFEVIEQIDGRELKDALASTEYKNVTGIAKGSANGQVIGYVVNITGKGYNPGIELSVGIGTDGKIKGISITEHSETAGLGAKAQDPAFYEKYKDKSIDAPLTVVKGAASGESEIQAITSATITTKGVTEAVNKAVAFYKQYFEGKEQ